MRGEMICGVCCPGGQLVANPENKVQRIVGEDPTLASSPGNKHHLYRLGSPFGASPSARSRSLGKVRSIPA